MDAAESVPVPETRMPLALRGAVIVLFCQVAILALLSLVLAYYAALGNPPNRTASVGVALYVITMTVLLALVSVGLARRRRWARAPAIVFELLQVMLGMTLLTSGQTKLGAPLLLPALLGGTLLFAPSTGRALVRRASAPPA